MDKQQTELEEYVKIMQRAAAKKYYDENKSEILARRKAKRDANLEEARAKQRAYYAKNKKRHAKWCKNHLLRKAEKEMKSK